MKVFKIVVILLVILFITLVIGLFVFLKTVDVNRYIPSITEQASKASGREIIIGKAGLQFSLSKGVALELKDITASDDKAFSDKPFLSVGRVLLGVDIGALFGGKILVTEIGVEGLKGTIIRGKDGSLNVATIGAGAPKPAAMSKQGAPSPAIALPVLLVRNFHINGAGVSYVDKMSTPASTVSIDQIDVLAKDFSLISPFDVSVKAAVFSTEQDIVLNTRVGLDLAAQGAKVETMKADVDLGKVALDQLMASLPMLAPAGLKEMKGVLSLDISNALVNTGGLKDLKAAVSMTNGRVIVSSFPIPIENITMKVDGDQKNISIKDLSFSVSSGEIHIQGTVKDYLAKPQVALSGKAQGIEAKGVSEAYKLPVKANGKVAAEFRVGFSGTMPKEIVTSLDTEMKMDMKEGSLEGINLLQTGLAKIPMLPGLLASVQSSLPLETQADLEKGITLINRCEAVAKGSGSIITIEKAELVTRDLTAQASGTVNLLGDFDVKADLFIEKTLAEALINKVEDLKGIKMDDGRIYIPLFVQGPLTKPNIQPDVAYLSKGLLLERGKDELQKVLEKNPEVQGVLNAIFGAPSQPVGAQTQPDSQISGEEAQPQPTDQGVQQNENETTANKAVNVLFNAIFEKK